MTEHTTHTNIVAELTEDQAMSMLHQMAARFGWAGTMFTRADAEDLWDEQARDEAEGIINEDNYEPMTDAEWDAIRSSRSWRSGMSDRLAERGWDVVAEAIREAKEATK